MCWPKRSVLKMGFRAADEDDSPLLFCFAAFAEGWWARVNRSEVARGMEGGGKKSAEAADH